MSDETTRGLETPARREESTEPEGSGFECKNCGFAAADREEVGR